MIDAEVATKARSYGLVASASKVATSFVCAIERHPPSPILFARGSSEPPFASRCADDSERGVGGQLARSPDHA